MSITKKFLALFLSLTMIIGLLPAKNLTVSASGVPDKTFSIEANKPLTIKPIPEIFGAIDINSLYGMGFSQPTAESGMADLYFSNPNDLDYNEKNYMLASDDVIYFYASTAGTYTFTAQIDDYTNPIKYYTVQVNVTSPNTAPTFVGAATTLTVNENSDATDIAGLLHVSDPDAGQTLTWSQKTAPQHGSLTFTDSTASTGGTGITPGGTISYTPTANYSGTDSFTVQVGDGTATVTRDITVNILDKTAPTGTITADTRDANSWSASWTNYFSTVFDLFVKDKVYVTIAANDGTGTGVNTIQYYKSTTNYSSLSQVQAITGWQDYTAPLPMTPADADKFIIYAKITDKAGNTTYINSKGIVYDLLAPSISTNYQKDAISMEVTVTDSGSGVDTVTYTVNGGNSQTATLDSNGKFMVSSLADGKYDVVITAKDKAGNVRNYTEHVLSQHTVKFMLFNGDIGSPLKTETVDYGSPATAPENLTRTGFVFQNWDKEFNNITADITVNATWNIGEITVTPYIGIYNEIPHDMVTVTGALPGDTITYSTNGSDYQESIPQFTNVGNYPVYVRVERPGYTAWESGPVTAAINRKTGEITIITDLSKTYDGSAVNSPTVSKNGTGPVTYTYYTDSSDSIGTTLGSAPINVGIYWVKASMAQDANFTAAEATRKFAITKASITGSVSIPNTVLTNDTVSANISGALPTGVTFGYLWKLDGTAIPGETGSSYTVKEADYGKTLTVTLTGSGDFAGSITSSGVKISENVKPTGEIIQETNRWTSFWNTVTFGAFFKDTVDIYFNSDDKGGSGVAKTEYYKSDKELTFAQIQAVTDWSTYSTKLSVTPADAEQFIIYAKITDNAGNVSYLNSAKLGFDLSGPAITTNYIKDAASMDVTVSDNGSGINFVSYKVNGGSPQTAALDSNGKFTVSSLPEGKYDVVITAKDTLDNENSLTVHVVSLYNVIYKLYNGDTGAALKTETVEYGNAAAAPANPTRTGFMFQSWDKDFSNITADTTVNATWNIGGFTVTPYSETFDGAVHNAVNVVGTLTGDILTYSTNGTDYTNSCPQYTNAGNYPIYVRVARAGYTTWESGLKTAVITQKSITSDMITNISSAEYSSQAIMPQPIMKFGSITLKNGTDYTIRYANNTNVGLATVAVSGQGNYTGTAAKQFAIYEKSVGVEIKDQQTPQTSVNGLQNLYQDTSVYTQDDHQVEQSGGSVKIQMSVQAVSDPSTSSEKIQKIASGKTIGLYLDLSLKKIVTLAGQQSSTTTAISHVNDLLTVVIPIPDSLKGKENLAIYRVHEGIASVIPLGKENAVDGEYCTIDANNITLYVKNFSTYAIGYASSKNQTTHNPNTGENPLSVPLFALSAVLVGLALANKVYKFKRKRSV